MAVDTETQNIQTDNKDLFDLVNHAGWMVARKIFVEKILELQNVSEYMDTIQTGNATKLLKDMKANKKAAEILYNILRLVEGGAQQAADDVELKDKPYIVRI